MMNKDLYAVQWVTDFDKYSPVKKNIYSKIHLTLDKKTCLCNRKIPYDKLPAISLCRENIFSENIFSLSLLNKKGRNQYCWACRKNKDLREHAHLVFERYLDKIESETDNKPSSL